MRQQIQPAGPECFSDIAQQAPKANHHLHLTGALSPADLRRLAAQTDVNLSGLEPLEGHLEFDDPTIWAAAKEVTSTQQGLTEALKTVLAREASDKVTYAEITMNPAGMLRRGLGARAIAYSVTEAAEFAADAGVGFRVKCGVNRKDGPESVAAVRDVFLGLPAEHRAYIDLNGDERLYATAPFISPFQTLVAAGIPVSVHAGEQPGARGSLEDALAIRPHRIAHAVAAAEQDSLLSRIIDQGITLEMAPTSNVATGVVSSLDVHPVKGFVEQGAQIVLGSDDPAFFGTTMTTELIALMTAGMDPDDVRTISQQSIPRL